MYSGATPEFIDGDVFKTKISLNEANRSDGGVNGGVSGGVSGGVKLSEINREVLECIKENGEFNAEKIAEKIKRGKRTVERAIKSLKEQGIIERNGSDKAGSWQVISFVVIFGDTGMEFPDTYDVVKKTQEQCEKDGTHFYIAKSHFNPEDSWKIFGPPARVLRWCCSVHKSTPQTIKMREITQKQNYTGMDFVGVRAYESVARSKYEYENFGKKQKGQYSYNPILEWTSAEVWLYIYINNLLVNETYKKGNSRAGCLFCPMGGGRGDYLQYTCYPQQVSCYIDLIKSMNARNAGNETALNSYVSNGGWNARKNGRDLTISRQKVKEEINNGKYIISVIEPTTNWREWIKTLGTVPFEYKIEEGNNGYKVTFDASLVKKYPVVIKNFKQVFRKSAYCVGCKVCQTNCKNGCISFENGLSINGCIHCEQCHDIEL